MLIGGSKLCEKGKKKKSLSVVLLAGQESEPVAYQHPQRKTRRCLDYDDYMQEGRSRNRGISLDVDTTIRPVNTLDLYQLCRDLISFDACFGASS